MKKMNEKQLLQLKEEIESAKTQMAELSGRQKYLREQLKKEWQCETVEEAEKKLQELITEVQELEEKCVELFKQIQEKYDV